MKKLLAISLCSIFSLSIFSASLFCLLIYSPPISSVSHSDYIKESLGLSSKNIELTTVASLREQTYSPNGDGIYCDILYFSDTSLVDIVESVTHLDNWYPLPLPHKIYIELLSQSSLWNLLDTHCADKELLLQANHLENGYWFFHDSSPNTSHFSDYKLAVLYPSNKRLIMVESHR